MTKMAAVLIADAPELLQQRNSLLANLEAMVIICRRLRDLTTVEEAREEAFYAINYAERAIERCEEEEYKERPDDSN